MSYYFVTILFSLFCKKTLGATDSTLSAGSSNFFGNINLPLEKSLLDSIAKSFEEQRRVYCIVMIYDDIHMKTNSLSKYKSSIFLETNAS